jgi:transcriptional regulator with XRE-family HTH domain
MPQTKVRNPIDKHVGSRVRMRRLMLQMSQTKLGDALGISYQQIQKYENGKNRIGVSRLQHISEVLQVPVVFFFEDLPTSRAAENVTASPDPIMHFIATSEGLALAKAFMSTPNIKLRRRIVDLVEEIVGENLH